MVRVPPIPRAVRRGNFWRPSDKRKPYGGWIVGYGLFARHELVPAWLAWDAFGDKNGAADFSRMRGRIEKLRRSTGAAEEPATTVTRAGDYVIGCLMISQPVFLDREAWVRPPAGWPDNAVQGKSYDLTVGEGARVWQEVISTGRRPVHPDTL